MPAANKQDVCWILDIGDIPDSCGQEMWPDHALDDPSTFAFRIGDAQLCHYFVGVMLVACPLFFRVVQVGRGAPVGVGSQQLHLVHTQLAGLHICMCPPDALQGQGAAVMHRAAVVTQLGKCFVH